MKGQKQGEGDALSIAWELGFMWCLSKYPRDRVCWQKLSLQFRSVVCCAQCLVLTMSNVRVSCAKILEILK